MTVGPDGFREQAALVHGPEHRKQGALVALLHGPIQWRPGWTGAAQNGRPISDPWISSLPFKLNQDRRRHIPKPRPGQRCENPG